MVYTDILVGYKSILFITDKNGEQKVYYAGHNYFGSTNNSCRINDIVELCDFNDKYGYITVAKNFEESFVFVTELGVYLCGTRTNGVIERTITEIKDFYNLYGNIIFVNINDKGICFYTTKNVYFYCFRDKKIHDVPHFIDIYGVPELIIEHTFETIFKTSKGLIVFDGNLPSSNHKIMLSSQELLSFENNFGKILDICYCGSTSDHVSLINYNPQYGLCLLVTENGCYNYEDKKLFHDEHLRINKYYADFIFYNESNLYNFENLKLKKVDNFVDNYGYIITVSISENYVVIITTNGIFYYYVDRDERYVTESFVSVPKNIMEIPNFFERYGEIKSNVSKTIKSSSSIF